MKTLIISLILMMLTALPAWAEEAPVSGTFSKPVGIISSITSKLSKATKTIASKLWRWMEETFYPFAKVAIVVLELGILAAKIILALTLNQFYLLMG